MESFDVILTWYLVTTLVCLAFTPLVLVLCRHLTDRGAAFARAFSVLALVWPAWFLSSFISSVVPFSATVLWATLLLGGVASWWLGWQRGVLDRQVLLHVVAAEAGFLVMFVGYVWFRGYDPTIQWQEKLSDLMMLSSTMRAESMPPNDAWLAGETINYYYAGYLPWAGIAKMLGTTPAIAYNLALASVFATTVVTVIGVAANVVGRFHSLLAARVAGILAALFLVFMATPWLVGESFNRRDTVWTESWYGLWWDATRRFDGGTQPAITEFPAFSFQLGDLHPHLLALPFTLLALGFAWTLAILPRGEGETSFSAQWSRIVVTGGIVGGLYAMNTWDLPIYLLIALLAVVVGTGAWPTRDRWLAAITLVLSALVLWLPFHLSFESPTASVDGTFADAVSEIPVIGGILASLASWYGDPSTLDQYTGLFGFMWVIALALIALTAWQRREDESDPFFLKLALGVGALVLILGVLMPVPLLLTVGLPIVAIIAVWQRDATLNAANVTLTLFGCAFMLTLVPEFVYLLDVFNSRMNTTFKLFYQAWTLFAVGAAIAVVVMWQGLRTVPFARYIVAGVVVLMALSGVTASAVGINQWSNWRGEAQGQGWIGMDGLYFLDQTPGWAGEAGGIEWLWENATNSDVMLAAGGCEFTLDVGTTAAGSGVPVIIGWEGHELQWHLGQGDFRNDVIIPRVAAINTLWETLDPTLLDEYNVTLLYIGPNELIGDPYGRNEPSATCAPGPFPNANDPNFPGTGWTEVYANDDGTRIYRRDQP